jgi:hypothetical protein
MRWGVARVLREEREVGCSVGLGNARNIGILARNLSNRASRRRLDCSLAAAAGAPSHFLMRFDSKKNDLFFIATDTQDFTLHLKNNMNRRCFMSINVK